MSSRLRLLLLLSLSMLVTQPGYGEPPMAREEKAPAKERDARANSLPAGALVRLGDARFRAGGGAVKALAFSSDGKTLISLDGVYEPATARFWDVASGRQVRAVSMSKSKSGDNPVLSADHQLVAWKAESDVRRGDDDKPIPPESVNVIDVWDLKSGQRLQRLQVPGRAPHSFSFSPDGKMLVSRHSGGVIALWDCATGRKLKQFQAPGVSGREQGSLGSVAWSPTGKRLAAAQAAGPRLDYTAPPPGTVIHFWTVPDGKLLDAAVQFNDGCSGLTFSADGKRLAVQGYEALSILDMATSKVLHKLRMGLALAAFSADGKFLAAVDNGRLSIENGRPQRVKRNGVWLVDLSNGEERRLAISSDNLKALAFSPDGKTLATGGYGGAIHLWDVATGKEKSPGRATALGGCIAFSGDGKTVATADETGAIRLWDARTGREVGVLPGKGKRVYRLRFSPDGRLLASVGGVREGLCVWEVAEGKLLWPDDERWKEALLPAFSPDGRTLAICFGLNYNRNKSDKSIRLCEARSGEEIRRLKAEVDNVVFSPDGKLLAGGCRTDGDLSRHDSGVRLWDAASGKLLREYGELRECENAESLTFAPDGRNLVVWHRPRFRIDHKLVGLELASGKVRWEIAIPYNATTTTGTNVAVTPDGRIAAVANGDRTIELYRLDTAEKLGQLAGHRGAVVDVAFAPDGKRLASVSWDKTALIWDMSAYLEKVRPRPRGAPRK